ncbi:MAG: ABC transporter permease [Patescibacteria group bacterium]
MRLTASHLKAGVDSVRGAKIRSFWTMLGVVIGVASVIVIVSIGEGIKQQIGGQIHHYGDNLIIVRPTQLGTGTGDKPTNSNLISGLNVNGTLGIKDISAIKSNPDIAASAPLTIASGSLKGDYGNYQDGFVIGTSSDLPSLINQSLAYGLFFREDDDDVNVAIIGQHASEVMFSADIPLGRSFTFHGERFIVRGIFNQFNSSPLSQQADFNNAIFIPNGVVERLTKNTAPTYEILARSNDDSQTSQVAAKLKSQLDKAHGGDSGLAVLTGNQNITASDDILNLLTRLVAGVAAISLFVGGVGIMNVMLVSVSERLHEIGIRKAVGATNGQIMSQFMIESTVLSVTGGVIGIALAFIIDLALTAFTSLKPSISWEIVLLASGVSLIVGVVFGTVPAIQAARKDPIEALRSE